jgi:hypothetical protein
MHAVFDFETASMKSNSNPIYISFALTSSNHAGSIIQSYAFPVILDNSCHFSLGLTISMCQYLGLHLPLQPVYLWHLLRLQVSLPWLVL